MSPADKPFVLEGAALGDEPAESPDSAPPPPENPFEAKSEAMQVVTRMAARRRSTLGAWFWPALSALLSLVISIAAYDYVTSLIARIPVLGYVAAGLIGLLALIVVFQILREMIAFRRLARIDAFRKDAAEAMRSADRKLAVDLSQRIEGFYKGREANTWAAARLAEQRETLMDADAVIQLTERTLFEHLDAEARLEIEAAARTIAGATALMPLALVDVLAALSINIRMIRRIAEIYGAHAGFLGSWRLLRSVAAHLIATGAVAVGDDMLGSFAGGHALAKISRRFGEGMINGALTARVGIAAMEVCRPLEFDALKPPRVSAIIGRSLAGMLDKKAD